MPLLEREVQTSPGTAQGRPWPRPRPRRQSQTGEYGTLENGKQLVENARSPVPQHRSRTRDGPCSRHLRAARFLQRSSNRSVRTRLSKSYRSGTESNILFSGRLAPLSTRLSEAFSLMFPNYRSYTPIVPRIEEVVGCLMPGVSANLTDSDE